MPSKVHGYEPTKLRGAFSFPLMMLCMQEPETP
jgi:hypothetical protein